MTIRLLFSITLLSLAACGEREQLAEGERTYQGKPDTPAWGTGDRAAWEEQINRRALAQNEYVRINN
jgi:hypothetical protein